MMSYNFKRIVSLQSGQPMPHFAPFTHHAAPAPSYAAQTALTFGRFHSGYRRSMVLLGTQRGTRLIDLANVRRLSGATACAA
jgi:hypothetical protein